MLGEVIYYSFFLVTVDTLRTFIQKLIRNNKLLNLVITPIFSKLKLINFKICYMQNEEKD